MPKQEYTGSVGPKGQITLPVELRRALGIKVKDRVLIGQEDGKIVVRPAVSKVMPFYGIAGRLREPLTWEEIRQVVRDEVAERVAKEGKD